MNLAAADFSFPRYLPMFDPDEFRDVAFFEELARIGYRQVLLGGTGAADVGSLVAAIRAATPLQVVLYPGGPGAVVDADLLVLPDVMNSSNATARPFGTGPVATANQVAARGLPFLPVAYFIMGESTAKWFYDARPVPTTKLLLAYVRYARMVGYQHVALDYEDPRVDIDPELVEAIASLGGKLLVSDEFDAARALDVLARGATTVITPSDVYEESNDPLALAAEMWAALGEARPAAVRREEEARSTPRRARARLALAQG